MAKVPFTFGDDTRDDVFTVGDELIDWSRLKEVAEQIAEIQSIDDPDDRLSAAKAWVAEMNEED